MILYCKGAGKNVRDNINCLKVFRRTFIIAEKKSYITTC